MIHFPRSVFTRSSKHSSNSGCAAILAQIFNEKYYLGNNPDVVASGIEGLEHYLNYGFKERRAPCDESDVTAAVVSASKDKQHLASVVQYQKESNGFQVGEAFKGKTLILPFHKEGNFFFKEISQHIADAAHAVGADALLVDERQFKGLEAREGMHFFIVAPQEFFYLGRKDRLHQRAKNLMPEVTYLLAEQPQTVFFLSQLEYIFDGAHIVDMNFHVATYLRSLGVACHYLSLGYIDSLQPDRTREFGRSAKNMYLPKKAFERGGTELNQRPVDAVFIGNGCDRRQTFFGDHAKALANFNMAVFMPDWKVPHAAGGLATLDANDSLALCQRSKIFLNIHRDNFEYFAWHRICMRGFLSGALVLTEPVFKVPEFASGVHYLECSLEDMPEKIDWLLNSDEGQQLLSTVASAGQAAYINTSMAESMAGYLAFVGSGKA